MKNLIYAKQTLKGILKEIQKSFLNPSPAIPKLETILIQTTEGTEIVSYAIREQLPVTNKDHPHTANTTEGGVGKSFETQVAIPGAWSLSYVSKFILHRL